MEAMLLSANGLDASRIAPDLWSKLGEDGSRVLAEAVVRSQGRVDLHHWLYALASAADSLLGQRFIQPAGGTPERFVQILESGCPRSDIRPRALLRLTSEVVSEKVLTMLATADRLARELGAHQVDEACLTLAVLQSCEGPFDAMLRAWAGEEGWSAFCEFLRGHIGRREPEIDRDSLFDENGTLDLARFGPSGRKICQQLCTEMQQIGAEKVTSLHLLHTLLKHKDNPLYQTLHLQGAPLLRDLASRVSREMTPRASRSLADFKLTRDSLLGRTTQVFVQAARDALSRGAKEIQDVDLSRALLEVCPNLIRDLSSPALIVDLPALRRALAASCEAPAATPDVKPSLDNMVREIRKRIRGQDRAVDRVMQWVKRLRFGLAREDRPTGVFMFLGPTGTGKTELAKQLARCVFGDEKAFLFIEMGQFQSRESVSSLVGAPPGYVGCGEGKLTNGLAENPECVVLFDEIDKAHPHVFHTLLRFADEGIISDPAGREFDGRKCIIVLTTNAGQYWLQNEYLHPDLWLHDRERMESDLARPRADTDFIDAYIRHARTELQEHGVRPEFMGRLDDLITFLPFDRSVCEQILRDVLAEESARLDRDKGIALQIEENAIQELVDQAAYHSIHQGARVIPRLLNEMVISQAIDVVLSCENAGDHPEVLQVTHDGSQGFRVHCLRGSP